MIRMGKESRFSTDQVVEKAVAFFGGEWGLDVVDRGECCARFRGAGGHVFVQASNVQDGSGTDVEVEGREWDRQIRQFMRKI